ncbi:peptidyl-glycine alpha-amidating monooxygenase-like isoform X2 [Pomacea canaliculata]|uniref:peptidyl-glycine alpha-amidating monooxygenase-like isoform X2 n=1 Tax=Pomacea canaliculata TaxID=400727 RepID=UPI000D7377F3|nr:peptidyl-glycine alpha-amidating monooxygenase-like isoform X2 [Pomacea canaliculata]
MIIDVKMKGAKPSEPDGYICTSYEVPYDEAYIVKYEAQADAETAHHILMYGCDGAAYSDADIWNCPAMCKDSESQKIIFAWAKNAPPAVLPKGVGFKVGRKSTIKTIVLQIHYAKSFSADEQADYSGIRLHLTGQKQQYMAGIFLLLASFFQVPSQTPKFHVDASCVYSDETSMFPFAYRTHAHALGTVITGYQYNGTFQLIGKGNPQWPQAFYPANPSIEVKPGEKLIARCTYNSTGRDRVTYVGGTGNDEMCNFYIMYYSNSSSKEPGGECYTNQLPLLASMLPADSDVPLPPNPLLDEEAHGHHHHAGMTMTTSAEGGSTPSLFEASTVEPLSGPLQFQSEWPAESVRVGQVGGLATDKQGNVYVFHRGTRIWNAQSFDFKHQFQFQNEPIKEDTVLIFSKDGKLLRTFGAGMFYMPHGMTVDNNGNIWLTDVALHQVFRIPAGGTKPDLELGERFINGDDSFHFCKPADVAVLTSGEFFVSDGYCNSRVVKFSKDGSFIKQWGSQSLFKAQGPPPGTFDIPHSITVAEDLGLVCVADRENSRIQCFDLQGAFVRQIKHKDFGSRLFAVEYCPRHGGLLFAVNGHSFEGDNKAQGFTIDARSGSILEHWNLPVPKSLHTPHDVAVDSDGHNVYVGELNPSAVWKFSRHINITTQHSAGTQPVPQAVIDKESITQIADKKNKIEPEPANPGDGTTMEPARKEELLKTLTDQAEAEKSEEEDLSDFTPSIIIGVLLVIPVILLLVITLVLRMHSRGRTACFSGLRSPKVFSLQGFLGSSHKGFDKLSQDDSDHEGDAHSDSDHEEFRQPQKGKNKA